MDFVNNARENKSRGDSGGIRLVCYLTGRKIIEKTGKKEDNLLRVNYIGGVFGGSITLDLKELTRSATMKKTLIQHARGARNRLKKRVEESGVEFGGKVLDVCCGKVSIGSIYSPKMVVCYDYNMCHLQTLGYRGISVVRGDVVDPYFPFRDDAFDFSFGSGLPTVWYRTKKEEVNKSLTLLQEKVKKQRYVKRILSEMIRVTKKDAIIHSTFFFRHFSEDYFERVKKEVGNYLIVLDCRD